MCTAPESSGGKHIIFSITTVGGASTVHLGALTRSGRIILVIISLTAVRCVQGEVMSCCYARLAGSGRDGTFHFIPAENALLGLLLKSLSISSSVKYQNLTLPAVLEIVTEDWPATPPKETAAAWAVRLVPRLLRMQGQVPFRPLVELLGKREARF